MVIAKKYIKIFYYFLLVTFVFSAHEKSNTANAVYHPWSSSMSYNSIYDSRAINSFERPNNPMLDRAFGYLLKGKAQAALTNYGRFVDWDYHPPGLWGNYTYLPSVAFVAGVPGQSYSYNYSWYTNETDDDCPATNPGSDITIWCSEEAYYDENGSYPSFSWYEIDTPNGSENSNFVSVVFDAINDDGVLGERLCSPYQLDEQDVCINGQLNPDNFTMQGGCNEECDITNPENLSSVQELCWEDCYDQCLIEECLDDNGEIVSSPCTFSDINQFCVADGYEGKIMISVEEGVEPNKSDAYNTVEDQKQGTGIGFVYPWAMRPALDKRLDDFDLYKYGDDKEEWTSDDEYDYYGANVAESWFSNWNPSANTDWHAASGSRLNTHNTTYSENDFFSSIPYLDLTKKPVLAHSEYKDTWPTGYNTSGELAPIWPGWNADKYSPEVGKYGDGCFPQKRWNDECWVKTDPSLEQFISDNDVYMEFDDRWAHRGNLVTNNEYQQTGYPMGLRVMAEAHSYGIEFAEDILFVTVQVRNESGDGWCAYTKDSSGNKEYITDYNGNNICGDAMVMPDGTKINQGKGFTYRGTSMGFYMDADVVTSTKQGSFGVHSNDDDFMEYYDCKINDPNGCDFVNDDSLRVSIAMIYDYDGQSNAASDVGIVATQLLDSPYATEQVKLTDNITIDVGEKLKMTDWHWFSWYTRPGVINDESSGVSAGYPGGAQARNKEEIQYKLIRGDTTNLSEKERKWYFHTPNPTLDDHVFDLNPHFDSLEGLAQTTFFQTDPDGLDCVLMMSSGPFSIEVGEQVPFSFCLIWGQNYTDLIKNAKFAQLMYNSHYQGYQGPSVPTLSATIGYENDEVDENGNDIQHHCIDLTWDNVAEGSTDVVTGYADFEGYKLYKSDDGGLTWGSSEADLADYNDPDSWLPIATFHLTKEQDEKHCTFSNDYHGECSISNPSYYISASCLDECRDVGIENDCDLDISIDGVAYESEWVDCIQAACGTCTSFSAPPEDSCIPGSTMDYPISTYAYNLLSDKDQLEYAPFYEQVNCNVSPWCTGDTCLDAFPTPAETIHHVRGYDVCGKDDNYLAGGIESLGACHDISSEDEEVGLKHSYRDCDVIDGIEYSYTLTAYDTGIPKEFITNFNDQYGIFNQSLNSANPLGFAAPSGYRSISSSKGRSVNDKNFVSVESGASPTRNMSDKINVVPNPYIVHSKFNETEYTRKIRFTHLPEKCKITIFTISGEKVISFEHDNPEDGNAWWDVRTLNNQEVAPGLYVFTVENRVSGYEHEKFVGKFAIIR
tara:strand:+ start:1187 stop:5059 length:3873 start_codon:yes stop_codon:yes gene_type:complete